VTPKCSGLDLVAVVRDFSLIGHALSAPARSAFIGLLMDGSSRPAGELAASARVAVSTASEHLGVLLDAGLIVGEAHGRHRLYRIANADVADALEQLGQLCPEAPAVGLRQSREARRLAMARYCYDHLAGQLGVALTDQMLSAGWLRADDFGVTALGVDELTRRGIDVAALRHRRRALTRQCLDWTERRPHLAGALGAAIAANFADRNWIIRRNGSRALDIPTTGTKMLSELWGLPLPPQMTSN